ncbi:MAG: class 1 fructose-bisphosphatase [Chitinophagaceae bacterium]|nr:class 1 fructose-bisphosphatase [Chitinophagaceae bacterium]
MEKSRIDLPIGITLDRFIKSNENQYPNAAGELSQLLRDIALASKVVNREINKAGLIDIMGNMGQQNLGGDEQQKLDLLANIRFTRALSKGGEACGIISEETESFIDLKNKGKYIVAIDPLDGSSNIDVNVSIGTIFSIFKKQTPQDQPLCEKDFLQKGRNQIAAGYILYGPSTMLVFSTGQGVNGFTYESALGEYVLSHQNMSCPENGNIYSINDGLLDDITQKGVITYLDKCRKKRLTARYIGSLVADFHRNLIKGGVFLYPPTTKLPLGKLRLFFEANALAFLIVQAGGLASTGKENILDITPTTLHERVALYIGSKKMVEEIIALLHQE